MSQSLKNQPTLFGDASVDHAIAGLGAGTVATLVMHPLDLVKVRFQLADSTPTVVSISSNAEAGPSTLRKAVATTKKPGLGRAVYGALEEAVKVDGWRGLYRGLIPNLVGGASSWGLYFLFYNMIKKRMQGEDGMHRTTSGQHLLAAAEASAVTSLLTNPIWVVKTRVFATNLNDRTAYRGLWDGLRSVYKAEGIYGLYKGSLLTLAGTANGSIQFATYEEIKRRRADSKRRRYESLGKEWKTEDEKLSNTEYILASGSSKLVAIALTYPYQVVRARIQNASTIPGEPRLRIPDVLRKTYANEGMKGFYKGLGTNALRILPGTCTTFVVYENLVWAFRALAVRKDENLR